MNNQDFRSLLEQLDDSAWQAVMDGQPLLMVDDLTLAVGNVADASAIVKSVKPAILNAAQLKQETISHSASILERYYFIHPLSCNGFEHQAAQHLLAKGAAAFAAESGQWPAYTLFVDSGELLAEPAGTARHRYGAFCELEKAMADADVEARVEQWLHSGDAYQQYLSMNVCRYNC